MLHLDSPVTPVSSRADLEAWRTTLEQLRRAHPDPADQDAIAGELARVDQYLRDRDRLAERAIDARKHDS